MTQLRYARSLNWSCISNLDCASALPPRPLHDYPPGFLPLHLAATVAALVFWWLRRILLPLELFAGRGADHLPAIPQEHQQPPRAWAVIDADRVGAAAAAIRAVLEESIRPGSPRVPADGYFRYPPIHYLQLEALPQVRMIDAESMDEMARGLVHGVEMLRQASIHYDDPIQRLSDFAGNPSIFHAGPCKLATESTEMVIKLKIATALVCSIWRELNGHNQQLHQELKEKCIAFVAGPFVEKLLEVACSLCDANWCACHVKEGLTIFDTLSDVLKNVQGLPLNRSGEAAVTLRKMVYALGGIIGRTKSDIDNSTVPAIHPVTNLPATVVFKQFLEFFGSNSYMVQSILETGDLTIDPYSHVFHCWVRKLEEDAETICQGQDEGQKCQKHIILLNNACDVWQTMRRPGASFSKIDLVSSLICMIQLYRRSYFDECWFPLIRQLQGDYLRNPRRSSLGQFTQDFDSICCCQMTWRVLPSIRYELRDEIKDAVATPYEAFVCALQANPRRLSELVYPLKRFMQPKKNQKEHTYEQLKKFINDLFEN